MTLRRAIELLEAAHSDELAGLATTELRNLTRLCWLWNELAQSEINNRECRPLVVEAELRSDSDHAEL